MFLNFRDDCVKGAQTGIKFIIGSLQDLHGVHSASLLLLFFFFFIFFWLRMLISFFLLFRKNLWVPSLRIKLSKKMGPIG